MIVRVLGEGQFDVPDDALPGLNELDSVVEAAVAAGDTEKFSVALGALLDAVRDVAGPHDLESLDESDLILPPSDATIDEVRAMLDEDGLIPG